MNDALKAGLIPNDISQAKGNSKLLEKWRKETRHLYFPHVCDKKQSDFCFYHLEEGVKLSNGERWEGHGIYTQLYFEKLKDNALVTMATHCSLRGLALINYGAFKAGQKRIGYGITDGPNVNSENARRWILDNVLVSWCEDGIRLTNTWIGTIRDYFVSWCVNGIHIPIACQAMVISVSGGEIGGNNSGYGILNVGKTNDNRFELVTLEGNALGGVLHNGINGKYNTIYDTCYFEGNGYYGPNGSEATGKARNFVIDSPADIGTRLLNCGFHDPGVPSYEVKQGIGFEASGNWHPTAMLNGIISSRGGRWTPGTTGDLKDTQEQVQIQ